MGKGCVIQPKCRYCYIQKTIHTKVSRARSFFCIILLGIPEEDFFMGQQKIYTKTGDKGETGMYGGNRIAKSSVRIDALGTVDELNSVIGMTIAVLEKNNKKMPILRKELEKI